MTKEQFEKGYIKRSGISIEEYRMFYVTLPCACGQKGCKGWAAVSKNPESIKAHQELYAPRQ